MAEIEALIREFREEYRDGRTEVLEAIARLNDKLDVHAREDDQRFDRLNRDIRSVTEEQARQQGRREAELWTVGTGRYKVPPETATIVVSHEDPTSWVPEVLKTLRKVIPYVATALGAGGGWEILRRLLGH